MVSSLISLKSQVNLSFIRQVHLTTSQEMLFKRLAHSTTSQEVPFKKEQNNNGMF